MKNTFCLFIILSLSAVVSPVFGLSKPVETQGKITLDGKILNYTATVGIMPIYDKAHKQIASMSYVAYRKNGEDKKRPLTFTYAGGPGSAALSDNFIGSGPKIIPLNQFAEQTKHSTFIDNPKPWLKFTDLVYIDEVGTGWGRPVDKSAAEKIFTAVGDAQTFSQFIQSYLRQNHDFNRPLYIGGGSYAGFRTPLVAKDLLTSFISVKGLFLLSPRLKVSYLQSKFGDMIAYVLAIPTYIRAALYHKRLSAPFQNHPHQTIKDGINWAKTVYLRDLLLGDSLNDRGQENLINKLHDYTGLSKTVIKNNHYKIPMSVFRHALMKDKNKVIDYTDARVLGNKVISDDGFFLFNIPAAMSSQLAVYPPAMHVVLSSLGGACG